MKLKSVSTITMCLLLLLGSCKKEEKLQERINGTWKTTSVKVNGTEELNVWKFSPNSICNFNCNSETKRVMETWSINDGGNILIIEDHLLHSLNNLESEATCSCIYYPEVSYDSDFNWTWELSSDGKTFTIIAFGSRYPYDVKELTKTKLQLSRTVGGKHQEYTFEKH